MKALSLLSLALSASASCVSATSETSSQAVASSVTQDTATSIEENSTIQDSPDPSSQEILVDAAPDFVRPYVLPKYRGRAIKLTPSQIIRFSITANSSGGAFSLLQHNGKQSGWLSARPHTHRLAQEHFYCARGRVQLWAMGNGTATTTNTNTTNSTNTSTNTNSTTRINTTNSSSTTNSATDINTTTTTTNDQEQARVASVGDYGNVPPGALHTFQLVDPDAQLTHVFQPAGFEHLFDVFSNGDYETSGISSPYAAIPADDDPFGPFTPEQDTLLRGLDLYAAPAKTYRPRRDFVNGTAGGGRWRDGPNTLPADPTEPYFVARDYGPKFLNSRDGYKVIQPLATAQQAADGNFTMGTIVMAPKTDNVPASAATLPHHFALQMEDGQLSLTVKGFKSVLMMHGDVAFVPANTPFEYYATVPYTKFLYMNAGPEGLDAQLLRDSKEWDWPAYPDV